MNTDLKNERRFYERLRQRKNINRKHLLKQTQKTCGLCVRVTIHKTRKKKQDELENKSIILAQIGWPTDNPPFFFKKKKFHKILVLRIILDQIILIHFSYSELKWQKICRFWIFCSKPRNEKFNNIPNYWALVNPDLS